MKKFISITVIILFLTLIISCSDFRKERKYLETQNYTPITRRTVTGFIIVDEDGNVGIANSSAMFESSIPKLMDIFWVPGLKFED